MTFPEPESFWEDDLGALGIDQAILRREWEKPKGSREENSWMEKRTDQFVEALQEYLHRPSLLSRLKEWLVHLLLKLQ